MLKIFKLSKLVVVLLLGLGLRSQAQTAVPASGGDATGSGGTASYSIGQIVYTTNTSISNGSVTQGVQQSYKILVVTGLEEDIDLTVSAYPNPTTDHLTLSIDNSEVSKLSYQLLDINGRLLETKKLESNQTIIATSHLMPAMYLIKVTDSKREVKIFKIIKY